MNGRLSDNDHAMKRRRFLKGIAAAPAAPALLAQQATAPTIPAAPATPPGRGGRGGRGAAGARDVPKLEMTAPDLVSEPVARFFSASQFAALQKLSGILVPPIKDNPGALDCGVPEFLDFLIGASPADRQRLYRNGLDTLNAQAKKQFGKAFADVDAKQADAILRPMLVAVPWAYDPPKDPIKHFISAARQDVQTATRNSREASAAAAAAGRRGIGGGGGQYWNPVDPTYKG